MLAVACAQADVDTEDQREQESCEVGNPTTHLKILPRVLAVADDYFSCRTLGKRRRVSPVFDRCRVELPLAP